MNEKTMPLTKQLFQMTWPMLIGLLAIMSCQLVDSAFIGQLGAQPLAALGFTIPVYQLIIGIQVGLGIATTTVISIALGAQKNQYARELGSLVIASGFMLILVLCLLIWKNQKVIIVTLGANEALFPLIQEYWLPWLVGSWLGAMLYFGYSIFRAHGETFLPGMMMVLTSILNIILDPIFIFVLDMGMAGAAWATICAFGIGCIIIYSFILHKQLIVLPQNTAIIITGFKRLLVFMTPAMMSQFIPPLSAMIATAVIAGYGDIVVAAWGLGSRLEFFSIIIVLALTMAMPPIIGKLRGSHDLEQIHQVVKIAVCFVIIWQLLVAIILMAISAPLSNLLTNDGSVATTLNGYLWIVPLSYGALGICMIMVSVCSAIGMPNLALVISALRLFGCYLPLLWIGSELAELNGLFIGAMLGNLVAGYMSWHIYKHYYKKMKSKLMN